MRPAHASLVLGLALSLLLPATASAQVPVTPQVQIEVDFLAASTADVDNLGAKLDRVPFPVPAARSTRGGSFLQCLTGGFVSQLYQTLVRTRGFVAHTPPVTTTDNTPATIQVPSKILLRTVFCANSGIIGPLQIKQSELQLLLTGLSIIPRINSDGSITLDLVPQIGKVNTAGGPRRMIVRTVPDGGMMVLAGLPFRPDKAFSDPELLIFVTPSVVGTETQNAGVGQFALLAPPTPGTPGATKTITLEVVSTNLRAVVALMTRQTGVKMSVLGAAESYRPVSVRLAGVSLVKTLQAIAASAGARVSRNAAGVYVFSPLPGAALAP